MNYVGVDIIWIRYSDGAESETDFSHLAGNGMFKFWNDYRNFERVHLSYAGAIAWSDDSEVCPDATYMRLTGKSVEDLFPSLQPAASDV
jgi:Protein of unknown function (DUF2442)